MDKDVRRCHYPDRLRFLCTICSKNMQCPLTMQSQIDEQNYVDVLIPVKKHSYIYFTFVLSFNTCYSHALFLLYFNDLNDFKINNYLCYLFDICMIFYLVDTTKRCIFSTTPKSQGKCILPCHCTKGCDTRTGACIGGGRCIDGHPSQHKWHGPACQTGEWNSFTYTHAHALARTLTHTHTRTHARTHTRGTQKVQTK